MSRFLAILLLLLGGCGKAPAPSPWQIRVDAVGPLRFGMSHADAQRTVGDSMASLPTTGCTYWRPAAAPPGISFMIENGALVRADIDSAGLPTPEGIGVGSTEAAIRNAYATALTIQLHKYQWEAGWRYFIYLPTNLGDSLHAMVFETDGQRVRTYHVGLRPQVAYVERCG